MVAIVTRAGKGSPLTNAEVDSNFTNLNNGKVENTQAGILAALGYTPYNATNPSGYVDVAGARAAISVTGNLTYNTSTGVLGVNVPVTSVFGRSGAVVLQSSDVTGALGFTPYNSTNPSGYIDTNGTARTIVENNGTIVGTRRALNFIPGTGISLSISDDSANEEVDITITSTVTAPVQSVFGRTGNVTLTSSDVTTALGYTPLSTAGGTLTGALTLQSAAPILNFFESDQTLPAGRRRLVLDGNSFSLRRNTAAAGDFSTEVNDVVVDSSSNFTAGGNVTAYSDERLKADWCDLPTDFVERLAQIKHGKYTRIDTGDRQVGASAQQWQALLPEAVMAASDDLKTLSLAYGNAAVVSAIQLAQRVVSLTARVSALEQKMGA